MHTFTVVIAIFGFLNHCTFAEHDPIHFSIEDWSSWNGYGGGPANRHYAEANLRINSSNIHTIQEKCRISYPNGVSAVPTTLRDQSMTYFPTWNGLFVALDYTSCQTKWSINVTEIIQKFAPVNAPTSAGLGIALVSRTSPQISGNVLYFGTQTHALIVAVDLNSGETLDVVQINPHPLASVTTSPTVFSVTNVDGAALKEVLFVGAASGEETAADFVPGYVCCSFVGNMVAVTFERDVGFKTLWDTPMIPSDIAGVGKWSGAAIWGSQPSIDLDTFDTVYIATGNTYAVPTSFDQCMNSTSSNSSSCLPSLIWQNSVIALDIRTGKPRWVHQIGPLDAWTIACGVYGSGKLMPSNCPQVPGVDADFGMAPSFVQGVTANTPDGKGSVLVVAQKNGNMYAIDPANGDIIWAVAASPGGSFGGLSWGIAVDQNQVYYTGINNEGTAWRLQPSNQTTNGSAYGAVNLSNGNIAWETLADGAGQAYGPPSVVGDIVFNNKPYVTQGFSAVVGPGGLVVLSSATGEILLEKEIDAPFHGGVAIQDNFLIFGTGYSGYNSNGSIYVMCVD